MRPFKIKEFTSLAILWVASVIATKLIFYKESFLVSLKVSSSFFFIFMLPGYAMMLYWSDKLSVAERLVVGTGVSFGLTGILSYYLGLLGLNIRYHTFLLPLLLIVLGIVFYQAQKDHSDDADNHRSSEAHHHSKPVDDQGSDSQAKEQ